ncbi:hypothetical protein LV84_03368 [Algoriphagus ratkowskyi]|uniref:Uncharacterized protein n=1 Tax=Algoriphagus ratkowskyi TaxID=57028 RepID=A0A2W7QW55_9BACT|nr:hypothetical protein [Algoriphagus ratkowskyi]PZX52758.1 hypothetical protein LV84_03368 [Algoriphagus ratkowskyi]TXD76295.1 hypothetical protein ESW18_17095 [Algoriphagus ratkowskyi]
MSISAIYPIHRFCKILVVLFCFISQAAMAQRISFSTWTGSDDIVLNSVIAAPELSFNLKQPIITSGTSVVINLVDNQAIAFRIEAPENFDLTVDVDAPLFLTFDDDPLKTIPFQVKVAYNNMMPGNELAGKAGAIELPVGFTNVTFPVNRRAAGAPGPPPSPLTGAEVRSKSSAYIYIYGSLGPVGVVPAGNYSAQITINVSFTSYD